MRFAISLAMGLTLVALDAEAASRFEYIAKALLVLKAPQPGPAPTPAPTGICTNCNGTGKLGDGTVSVPCPICGGDGRTDNDVGPPPDQHAAQLAELAAIRGKLAATEAELDDYRCKNKTATGCGEVCSCPGDGRCEQEACKPATQPAAVGVRYVPQTRRGIFGRWRR